MTADLIVAAALVAQLAVLAVVVFALHCQRQSQPRPPLPPHRPMLGPGRVEWMHAYLADLGLEHVLTGRRQQWNQ